MENFEKKLLIWYEKYNTVEKLSNKYNPWINGKSGEKLINLFLEAIDDKNNDFSWLKHERSASRYSIPNYIYGNFENSILYQCLYNPGVDETVWQSKATNILDFKKENLNTSYIKRMFNISTNSKNEEARKSVLDKIIVPENIIYTELTSISGQSDENLTREFLNTECYYISHYFKNLIADNPSTNYSNAVLKKFQTLKKDGNFDDYMNLMRKVRICNLELVPFASRSKGDMPLKNISEIYTDFQVSIILFRIAKFIKEGKDRPIFIFRSQKEWFKRINSFIQREIYEGNMEGISTDFLFQTSLIDHFYTFNSQNGCLSANNIQKANNGISIEEFKENFQIVFTKG